MTKPEFKLDDSALLIVDMISDFSFPDGDKLVRHAEEAAPAIAAIRARFQSQKRPVIYVNDNFDRWTSEFSELVDWASRGGSLGRKIVDLLLPGDDDYFILKPRHSAFYETALPSLLKKLDVQKLVITGVAGDSCVLSSAMDAHMRGFPAWVPANASASLTVKRNVRAMQFLSESLECDIEPVKLDP